MQQHTEDDCKLALGSGTSYEAWTAVGTAYRAITYALIIEAFEKVTSQQSETFKTKAALTASIQQSIAEFCELASVSSTLMKDLEPLFLYQSLGLEFYHLKEQIKAMKQSEVNPEKIQSLINSHSVIASKPPASVSAAIASGRKQKAGQEDLTANQNASQPGQLNLNSRKRQKTNQASKSKDFISEKIKYNHCGKPGHLEKDCWIKDCSKQPQKSSQAPPAAAPVSKD